MTSFKQLLKKGLSDRHRIGYQSWRYLTDDDAWFLFPEYLTKPPKTEKTSIEKSVNDRFQGIKMKREL